MAKKTDYEDFEGAIAEEIESPKKEKKGETTPERVDYLDGQTEEQYCSWVDGQIRQHPVVINHHGKWREHIEWWMVSNTRFGMMGNTNSGLPTCA